MTGPRRRPELAFLISAFAVLGLVCAIAFPLAPVTQPVVTFAWPQPASGTATALPLMPYQPVAFQASIGCDAARATPRGGDVLTTTPEVTPDTPVGGLRVQLRGTSLSLTSNGDPITAVPLPPGPCDVVVDSTPSRTEVTIDGRAVTTRTGDLRPVVAAIITDAPTTAGLAVRLQTDTRFQTTPSLVKWLLGAGVVLGAIGMIVGLVMLEGRRPRAPGRSRAPRAVDVLVAVGLLAWTFIGPASVDDGYISGIIRGRGENGFTGNVYRWLNAPEAPFSWFYEVIRAWDALAPGPASTLWMRVPALVLGLLLWLLVSRVVLPRLGPLAARPTARWVAAVAFAAWWLPFGLTLRPEPWVALGSLAVWVLTERAVATARCLPLVLAAMVGGLTVALTPGALVGVVPLLVALPALVRGARRGSGALGPARRVLALVAALAVSIVPMFADQSLAAVLEGTRVRQVIGGGEPWYDELDRYQLLLDPDDLQGGLAARLPVLLLLVAIPAVIWAVQVLRVRGIAPAPARRLLATTAIGLVLLTFSPTKWTLHFGTFAGLGTAVLTLFVVAWTPRALRSAVRPAGPAGVGVLAGVVLATALVLVGRNRWAYASGWGVFWDDIPPQFFRIELSDIVLYGGLVAVLALAVMVSLRPTRTIGPAAMVVALMLFVTGVVGMSFVKVTGARLGSFSYGSSDISALQGRPCGLAPRLAVETDPIAGLLGTEPGQPPPADGPDTPTFTERTPDVGLVAAGKSLPGWVAPTDRRAAFQSQWYVLPPAARERTAPVVVTVSGTTGKGSGVALEFAAVGMPWQRQTPVGDTGGTAARDLRALAPEGTSLVRVVASSDVDGPAAAAGSSPTGADAETPLAVSRPRVPITTPFDDVLAPGSTALVDWPVAFVFPCLRPPALTSGTAELPGWRIVPPGNSNAGEIAVAPTTGGPFLTPRLLVDEVRFPVYLDNDPTRDAVGLARWLPSRPYGAVAPEIGAHTIPGWEKSGRVTVPVLDGP